jgi:hypothetical protein
MPRRAILLGVVSLVVLSALAISHHRTRETVSTDSKPVHVMLIGASIGQAWHLAEWPARTNTPGFTAESLAIWKFDKTEGVEEALMRPRRKFRPTRTYLRSLFQPPPKPDVVILKECSSYFPGDLGLYEQSVQSWVGQLQARGMQVILATVVPVTRTRDGQAPGKQGSLLEYNNWVRQYAQEQHIPLLDLEAALRSEARESYLREAYDAGDGTHINASAYAILDQTLRSTLCNLYKACDPISQSTADLNGSELIHKK